METKEDVLARHVATDDAIRDAVPKSVTNYQIKRALNTNPTDRAAVEALVDGADQDTKDGWNHAQEFKSDHDLFISAVETLGWSQEKVNDYLKLAKTFN